MSESKSNATPVFMRDYRNAVDAQWRVTVPSAWRFEDRADFFIRVKKDHLVVFPRSELTRFQEWADKLSGADRATVMEEWGRTTEQAKIDSAGRLTLPSDFAKLVGIETKKDAMLIGSIVNFKIWSAERHDAESEALRARGKALLEGFDGA
jgi:DNA-binding transcriptional regulator/RsmH inhibitor MraZ